MPKQKKLISSQAAAKILGTTPENIRQLAKQGVISSVLVSTGKKGTRYFYESEINARKAASAKYISIAKKTSAILDEAKRNLKEAEKARQDSVMEMKRIQNWPESFVQLYSLADSLLSISKDQGKLTDREKDVIHDIMSYKTLDSIAKKHGISRERVRQILTAALKRLAGTGNRLRDYQKLKEQNDALMQEVKDLTNQISYIKNQVTVTPDDRVIVLSREKYAKRSVLLSNVEAVFGNYAPLKNKGITKVYQLVSRTPEQLRTMGITASDYSMKVISNDLRFGMDLTEYGIFNNAAILRANNVLKGEDELDPDEQRIRRILLSKVADYGLTIRCINCMGQAGIETFADLCSLERDSVRKWRNFGRKSMRELDEIMCKLDLHFGMDVTKYGLAPSQRLL